MNKTLLKQKGFSPVISLIIIVILAVGVYLVSTLGRGEEEFDFPAIPDGITLKEDGTIVEANGTIRKPDGTVITPDGKIITMPSGVTVSTEEGMTPIDEPEIAVGVNKVIPFTQVAYNKAIADGKLVVLYFYASWCPICKAEFPKMESAVNKLPNEVMAFQVNYRDDNTDRDEEALAKKFGITYQHTKVILKGDKQLLKDLTSWDEEKYLTEIKKLLSA